MSDQKMNDHLKEIAMRTNVEKNLTMHVGRHTFATRLLSKGGKLERLKELLGHLKIESTMIYGSAR
ncbi:tyrosine-type recombinase/integrase [Larkinella sp.]|uniref:tyrosine-type recombinase/integrase n=1 Tax=Larkinella sp. TaxID=2034517 RepID=UPI003BA848A8